MMLMYIIYFNMSLWKEKIDERSKKELKIFILFVFSSTIDTRVIKGWQRRQSSEEKLENFPIFGIVSQNI